MEFTALFRHPSPFFEAEPGDLIVIQPALSLPYTCLLSHPIPLNYGALLAELESGTADLVTPNLSVAEFAAAIASGARPLPAAPPSPPRPRRHGPLLFRLK